MTWRRFLAVLLLSACMAGSANAGINLFGKKPKVDPHVRVAELLGILKSDADEHKRAAAAEELREFDGNNFPDIVPVLIDALGQDAKASVRAEAAQSLGKIRPISQNAGAALEQALAKDSSMRVRLQARSALLAYNWAGYKSKSKDTPPLYQTGEPPLADPPPSSTSKAPPPTPLPPPTQSRCPFARCRHSH
jgi:hypothetical protein